MLDRPRGGENAILVHIDFSPAAISSSLEEFNDLALSAGAQIAQVVTGKRRVPESKYFVGNGKALEIKEAVALHKASLVIFNHELSPAQERNLEKLCQCRVIGRTGLILDIFAQRARSFEGKLQVELALYTHLSTRLVRGWTHLERQKGGIGLRGPGETQLETDRRLLRNRIKIIHDRLEKVIVQRNQNRKKRAKSNTPSVSLIGYTNAGKSTLFNCLTQSDVYVKNQLFATLDPTFRQLTLPHNKEVVLIDTVGFISHLPHHLIDAFQATLQESREADLLIHVIDASDEHCRNKITEVETVLEAIEASHIPRLHVFNKIDTLENQHAGIDLDAHGFPKNVWLSAKTGEGIELLKQALSDYFAQHAITRQLCLPPIQSSLRAKLYAHKSVLSESMDEQGNSLLTVRMNKEAFAKLFGGSS